MQIKILFFLTWFSQKKSLIEICTFGYIAPSMGTAKVGSMIRNSKDFNLIYHKGFNIYYKEK